MKKVLTLVTLFLCLTLTLAFAGTPDKVEGKRAPQVFSEKSPGHFNGNAYIKQQQKLYDFLVSESAQLTPESILKVNVTAAEMAEVNDDSCASCGKSQRVRVGLAKPTQWNVNFTGKNGRNVEDSVDGGFVWTMAVESPDAVALRLHLSNFQLPANAALFLYNMDGEAFGPYFDRGPNDSGDFWTHTVSGSVAYLQVHHFGPADPQEKATVHFNIANVAHLGNKFLVPFMQKPQQPKNMKESFCSFNASCVLDATCYSNTAINGAKDGVAHMQFVSGLYVYICSGGLLNDTVTATFEPYFLTANHCISTASEASSLECYWQFKTSTCGGACYNPVGAVPRTLGADILRTSATSDYCFLKLRQNPPSGSTFLGWTSAAVAFSNGTTLYRVSHPQGAPQAYSRHQVSTSKGTCGAWPRGNWIYSQDMEGATEGGSSGSPVLNSSGQVVGQLSGGCGYNLNDVCDSVSNATVDGAFAAYYSQVSQWLDPSTTPPTSTEMHVSSIVLTRVWSWFRYKGKATVTILDENNNPVSGATVYGTFSGDVSGSYSATTNASGVAVMETGRFSGVSNFSYCVTNVTHSSLTYDSSANVETCDNY